MSTELERFKREINLVDFAVSKGYEVDRRESSRASIIMRGPANDKIVVATGQNGYGIYFSVRDPQDNGTIINFIKNREGLSLPKICQELRSWVASPLSYHPRRYVKPKAASPDRHAINLKLARMKPAQGHSYLKKRGLSLETLKDERFAPKIRVNRFGSAVFPHQDRLGLCGAEIKGENYTGFLSGGLKGLWLSAGISKAKQIMITESAIDALSYAQIMDDPEAGYVSIGGSLSDHQRALLRDLFKKAHSRGVQVIVTTDMDTAGHNYAREMAQLAPPGMHLRRQIPIEGKDWNEELLKLIAKRKGELFLRKKSTYEKREKTKQKLPCTRGAPELQKGDLQPEAKLKTAQPKHEELKPCYKQAEEQGRGKSRELGFINLGRGR